MNKTLLVMAGGTGGHIFPALAVADVWISRRVPAPIALTSGGTA